MQTMNDIPTDDAEFKAEYIFAIKEMFRYRGMVGAQVWADRAALLYDSRPEFCDAIGAAL